MTENQSYYCRVTRKENYYERSGCAFRKGDLESMCKAYLCMRERTLDCLVFKVVKEKFKRNVTEF